MVGPSSGILAEPVHEVHGLSCGSSERPVMPRTHRHDDVELALAVGGWVEHEHGGKRLRVPAGTLVVLWAGLPHRVGAAEPGAEVRWLTVPLPEALAWDVEGGLTSALLRGQRVVVPDRTADAADMRGWQRDLRHGRPPEARAARLEIRALLARLSVTAPPADGGSPHQDDDARRAADMAAFVAERFRDPIGVGDVARHVHVHPATAAAVFRAVTGSTVGSFLVQCRLAEAQRLLLVTSADVAAVAARAGFGSTSAFYAAFTSAVGEPPAVYRRRMAAQRLPE